MADETKKPITKRFSLSKEEREKVGNIQSVMGILALLRRGMDHTLTLALMEARVRMNIKDSDAPKGYVRSVDFDPQSDELIVVDVPEAPEPDSGANHAAGSIPQADQGPDKKLN